MKSLSQKINEARKLDEADSELKKYGIKELKGGLTLERLKKDFPWILKAKIKDLIITLNWGEIQVMDGTWEDGTWENGNWKGGTWKGGTWKNGSWYDGVWENGTWEMGYWYGGTWKGGTWKKGLDTHTNKMTRFDPTVWF